jgi:hypothetical protein
MPGYIPTLLHKFQHKPPFKHQGAPHSWTTPTYGAKVQYATPDDSSPVLPPARITIIQKKIGTLLYYAVSVDPFMLPALGTIASSQAAATQLTQNECDWLMDYAASNPLSTIRYYASDMQLYVHSDASYLSETRARSRAAGHFFLSDKPIDPTKPPEHPPPLNGPIHTLCKIIDVVVGSAAEAEIGAGYLNGQEAVPIVTTLEELGHPQGPTPMQVDNTTSDGFANGTMKQRRSKAMDMRWYWLRDRVSQGKILVYYRPGKDNLADPFTKHHTPAHIQKMKPNFLSIPKHLAPTGLHQLVRGCVNSRRVCPPTVRPRIRKHTSQAVSTPNNEIVIAPTPNRWSNRVAH